MTALLIVIAVVIIIGFIALVVFNPILSKREDAAVEVVNRRFATNKRILLETRATAMGTEPDEAGGVRGMSVLAVNSDELVAVTWSGLNEWHVARSAITSVESSSDDPEAVQKATVIVHHAGPEGAATASFRLKDPVPWLTELGYDWGPEGPPAPDADADA